MAKTILVLGGSGFIGREICRVALCQGSRVISLSRSGRPSNLKAEWANQVEWVAEDVFNLSAWQKYLEECQAVIHAITIILEKPQAGLTYDRVITGSTKLAADAANETGTSKFVYLSLQEKPPFISKTFLEAKRQAETCLVGRCFKSVILRPALVYGKARPPTVLAASIMKLVSRVAPGRAKNSIPLAAEAVAKVAVKAALDPQMEGVLDVAAIQHISQEM